MGWAITKAHGVLPQGRATTAVFFYDPQGVIIPPCIEKFDAEICIHFKHTYYIIEKIVILHSGVGYNKSPWGLTAGEGHHGSGIL